MNIKPIKTKTDYRRALKVIEGLMSAKANTPDGDQLDVLVTLVEAYERTHFPMDLPDAVAAITCVFHAMPVTDSAACRSVIPAHAGR